MFGILWLVSGRNLWVFSDFPTSIFRKHSPKL